MARLNKKTKVVERWEPEKWLKESLPPNFFTKPWIQSDSTSEDLEVKRRVINALILISAAAYAEAGLTAAQARKRAEKELNESIDRVIDGYEIKAAELKEEGVRPFLRKALNDEALLKKRVQNQLIFVKSKQLILEHKGYKYVWLESTAKEKDPYHLTLVGRVFNSYEGDNEGNRPGERFGCQCGADFTDEPDDIRKK